MISHFVLGGGATGSLQFGMGCARERKGNELIRRFQIYGERCSGTNALIRLVEANFPELTFTEDYGFKHWLVPEDMVIAKDVAVIVIAREVGEWLRSLYRQPWHTSPAMRALSFSDFIRAPWDTIWDTEFWNIDEDHPLLGTPIMEERCPVTGDPFANAITMRNAKLANWTATARRAGAALFFSHEQLVQDPVSLVRQIETTTGCSSHDSFVPVRSYKGQGNRAFRARGYEPLNESDRHFVADNLDEPLEALFTAGETIR